MQAVALHEFVSLSLDAPAGALTTVPAKAEQICASNFAVAQASSPRTGGLNEQLHAPPGLHDMFHIEIMRGVGRIAGEHHFVSPEEPHPLPIAHGHFRRPICTVTIQGSCDRRRLCAANMIFTLCKGLHQYTANHCWRSPDCRRRPTVKLSATVFLWGELTMVSVPPGGLA